MRRVVLFVVSLATTVSMAATPSPASAYGGGADHDMWQVGLSGNCNNPSVCPPEAMGGFWGWVEFDRAGTTTWGDAKLAFCTHQVGGGGPGTAGAGHATIEIESWTIEPGSAGPQTFFASGEETDSFAGHSITFDITHEDTGIPAVPGHYSTVELLGFSAPGVAFQVQVAFRPAK